MPTAWGRGHLEWVEVVVVRGRHREPVGPEVWGGMAPALVPPVWWHRAGGKGYRVQLAMVLMVVCPGWEQAMGPGWGRAPGQAFPGCQVLDPAGRIRMDRSPE